MKNADMGLFKSPAYQEQEKLFFDKLEKFTGPLRFCAHEMVDCIEQLSWKSKELTALKDAYHRIETIAVSELSEGIELIKSEFSHIDFSVEVGHTEALNNAEFIAYFDKQNHFNAEINMLVKKAIEIAA